MKSIGEGEKRGTMMETRYLLGTIKVFLFIMILTLNVLGVYSLEISEIELNPEGSDSGNEWVELYSDDEIDLEGYYLENGDGDFYNLSGEIDGFLVIEFDSQWLDNSDELVLIRDSEDDIVDESPIIEDGDNDELTWQNCEGSWIFESETKDDDNECSDSDDDDENDDEGGDNQGDDNSYDLNSNIQQVTQNNQNNQNIRAPPENILVLNQPKVVENEQEGKFITKQEKIRRGVIYSFMIFMGVLIALLAWRRL